MGVKAMEDPQADLPVLDHLYPQTPLRTSPGSAGATAISPFRSSHCLEAPPGTRASSSSTSEPYRGNVTSGIPPRTRPLVLPPLQMSNSSFWQSNI